MLLRGERGAAGAPGGGVMPAESNILRMAPVGPRFSYLPVTTPTALLRQASHHLQPAGSDLARLGSGLLPAVAGAAAAGARGAAPAAAAAGPQGAELSAAAYSFANLLSGREGRASGEDAGGDGGAAGAAAGGMAKLAAGLQGLQGLIGEQLGDMSSAQGLLSSLGARFNK